MFSWRLKSNKVNFEILDAKLNLQVCLTVILKAIQYNLSQFESFLYQVKASENYF